MKLAIIVLLAVPAFFIAPSAAASLRINEIAWMGSESSAADEWLEFYNDSPEAISLEDWNISWRKVSVALKGVVEPHSFYLLERTNDQTVAGQAADLVYQGGLSNQGEQVLLYHNDNLIDQVNFSSGWQYGSNATKQTMERANNGWQTSRDAGGTPKQQNSVVVAPVPKIIKDYPDGVIFSELLPSPEGPDEIDEWIEFFNENNVVVNLQGWKIKDASGATFTIKSTVIESNEYLLLERPTTKISLNNNQDALTLLSPDGKIIDSIEYQGAKKGLSYSRQDSEWHWSKEPTPGAKNTPLKEVVPTGTAAAVEALPLEATPSENPWILLAVAIAIAIVSAIIVVVIKLKLSRHVRT